MTSDDPMGAFAWTSLALVPSTQPDPAALSSARRRIFDLVCERPGITISALAERAQIQWAAAQFHVLRLESAGLVATRRIGRRRLVFPGSDLDGEWPEERALLEEPACRAIAKAIIDAPGRDALHLVQVTGLSSRVVYHHARKLVELGLAVTPHAGHYRGLRPTPKLYALLGDD